MEGAAPFGLVLARRPTFHASAQGPWHAVLLMMHVFGYAFMRGQNNAWKLRCSWKTNVHYCATQLIAETVEGRMCWSLLLGQKEKNDAANCHLKTNSQLLLKVIAGIEIQKTQQVILISSLHCRVEFSQLLSSIPNCFEENFGLKLSCLCPILRFGGGDEYRDST
ncbi:hypothetical protein RHMOL_Rhmol04G0248000 [Rhododendron molle]|uniref:Uncharacterized protein n=1 Tax=Rhododendron molle TaxID=49168 RepID=A0ACC0P5S6_RHOML|nr:hypothetical protein RHMOL_Rhmol04G0248000 [Rhododendron molle]